MQLQLHQLQNTPLTMHDGPCLFERLNIKMDSGVKLKAANALHLSVKFWLSLDFLCWLFYTLFTLKESSLLLVAMEMNFCLNIQMLVLNCNI